MPVKIRLAWLTLVVIFTLAFNSCGTSTRTGSQSATNPLWITTANDQKVRSYAINETNGSVSQIGSGASATGLQSAAIALSPDRLTLFVANSGDNSISIYSINSDGSLTAAGVSTAAGNTPTALAVDPAYTLLFVANKGSDSIMVFSITPGVLTLKTSFPIQLPAAPGGSGPVALVVSPAGFSCTDNRAPTPVTQKCFALYAANQTSSTVTAYDYFVDSGGNFVRGSIDLNGNFIVGGTVTGSPYAVGMNPSALAFSRCAGAGSVASPCQAAGANGLFVADSGSDEITVLSACIQLPTCLMGESTPDGTLAQLGSPVPTGTGPSKVLVDPLADFVYSVDVGSNQVSEYQYQSATGVLTPIGAVNAGNSALSAAITNNLGSGTNNWVVVASSGALSPFSIGSDGSLTAGSGQTSVPGQPTAILIQ